MSTKSCFDRIARNWRALDQDESGNVAIIFAACLIPLLGLIGLAIDYSQANALKASMQAAADAAALAVSKDAATQSAASLQSAAQKYFNATFTGTNVTNLQVTATYSRNPNSQVVINVSANTTPRFMSMSPFNIAQVPITASSTTTWGNKRLRVALVLDNTGSMSSAGKMTALKSAATSLLDQLKAAAGTNGDVYVSIIPFSKDVNVGTGNTNANWLKWAKSGNGSDAWDQNNGNCTGSGWGWGWGGNSYDNEYDCTNAGKTWNVSNHNTWNGCVMDRDQNYDTTATAPVANDAANPSTLFWPEQYSNCPVELMTLSYDWTSLKNKVNAMSPNGSTNQAIGLAWGWLSLLQQSPLNAPAEDATYQYQKIIILLTDGLNTLDRWYGNGSSVSTQVDARQQILCNNVKNTGIVLYTVQVNTDGDPTSTLLQGCASPDSTSPAGPKFFLLTSASQIITTFNQIGTSLSQLRVAK